jgi:hypothetical protein
MRSSATNVATYQLVLATETLTQAQFFPQLVNSAPQAAFSYQLPTDAFIDVDNDALTYSATLADGSAGLEPFSYQLSSDAFIDVDGDILTYSATLADGSCIA